MHYNAARRTMGMLLSVCMLAGGVAAVSSAQTTAVADPVTSTCSSPQNPMGGSTPKNSNAGFTIFTTGDADLENSELEGSLAVGGSAYFGNGSTDYPIFHNDAGSGNYSLPTIEGDSTRVLLNEYDSTSTRRPHITSRSTNSDPGESGLAKLMTVASGSTFSQANSGTQYNPGGSASPLSPTPTRGPVIPRERGSVSGLPTAPRSALCSPRTREYPFLAALTPPTRT